MSFKKKPHSIDEQKFKRLTLTVLVNLIIVFFSFRSMFQTRFSPDGYGMALNFFNDSASGSLNLGRISTYLVTKIMILLNCNPTANQIQFSIIFCIIIAWASSQISILIISEQKHTRPLNNIVFSLSVLLAFINVFYTELFYFSDGMLFWSLGLFFCVLAIYCFWKARKTKQIAYPIIFLFISFGFYQAYLGFFVIFGSILILVEYLQIENAESLQKAFSKWLILLFDGGVSSFLIIVSMKAMTLLNFARTTDRSPSLDLEIVYRNIRKICLEQSRILIEGLHFWKWGILVTLLVLIFMLIILFLRYKISIKTMLLIGFLFLTDYILIFAPHVFAKNVWIQPRTICSFFGLLSYGLIVIATIETLHKKKIFFVNCLLIIVLAVNISKIDIIGKEQCISNVFDKIEAYTIVDNIEKYEEETGIKVDTIYVHYDKNITWGYNGIKYAFEDVNRRLEHVSWALGDCLEYYTTRKFSVLTTEDEKHNNIFMNKDWDSLIPEEQFVFDRNVIYIAAY